MDLVEKRTNGVVIVGKDDRVVSEKEAKLSGFTGKDEKWRAASEKYSI